MADYIKREDVDRVFEDIRTRYARLSMLGAEHVICKARDLIDEIPAADVREYVPGKWLHTDAFPHRVYCSVCFATYLRNEKWAEELQIKLHPNYCPNCGAQMEVNGDE